MRVKSLLVLFFCALFLNACFIGDRDDLDIVYQPTIIEVACQTAELTTFCKLLDLGTRYPDNTGFRYQGLPVVKAKLMFATREGENRECSGGTETVFAPNNQAWEDFLTANPQWPSIDSIPPSTVDRLLRHHIHAGHPDKAFMGRKLFLREDTTRTFVCAEELMNFGSANPYQMLDGSEWIFAQNSEGEVRPLSLSTGVFGGINLETPAIETTDGIVYIVDKVLGPF